MFQFDWAALGEPDKGAWHELRIRVSALKSAAKSVEHALELTKFSRFETSPLGPTSEEIQERGDNYWEKKDLLRNWRRAGDQFYVFSLTDFVTYLKALTLPDGTRHRELIDWASVRSLRKEVDGRYGDLAGVRNDIAHAAEVRVQAPQLAKRRVDGPFSMPGLSAGENAQEIVAQIRSGDAIVHTDAKKGANQLAVNDDEVVYIITVVERIDKALAGGFSPER